MGRRFVNELTDGERVSQVFMASEKQLRPNRQGNLYLQLRLSDKTGSVTAMLWNATQKDYDSFENGDYVEVSGSSQLYNGNMQVLAKGIKKADPTKVDESEFITLSGSELEKIVAHTNGLDT